MRCTAAFILLVIICSSAGFKYNSTTELTNFWWLGNKTGKWKVTLLDPPTMHLNRSALGYEIPCTLPDIERIDFFDLKRQNITKLNAFFGVVSEQNCTYKRGIKTRVGNFTPPSQDSPLLTKIFKLTSQKETLSNNLVELSNVSKTVNFNHYPALMQHDNNTEQNITDTIEVVIIN